MSACATCAPTLRNMRRCMRPTASCLAAQRTASTKPCTLLSRTPDDKFNVEHRHMQHKHLHVVGTAAFLVFPAGIWSEPTCESIVHVRIIDLSTPFPLATRSRSATGRWTWVAKTELFSACRVGACGGTGGGALVVIPQGCKNHLQLVHSRHSRAPTFRK